MKVIETTKNDIDNVISLWADGDVMSFVGFPDGYKVDMDYMEKWIVWATDKPKRCHYSIYTENVYCGETFYSVNDDGYACLDIKLFPFARGKGVAYKALTFVINKAFDVGKALVVYVDPNIDNTKAWNLYTKMGFIEKKTPKGIDAGSTYQEITREEWEIRKETLM